ncbi:MAG TPA: TldD/PmbA family protein [Euryarchaeota archaeon]|nr:MAG: TldD/PmbA family protein [Thermoplasmata archaeon]RLF73044.1 MAG: TldD/PmbA family protein [Thermoplasmata archaeon]HDD59542.1 TldD/PmbA family protein [Euryarchaeota archaeon]
MKDVAEKALSYGEGKADYLEIRAERKRYSVNFLKNGILVASTEGIERGFAVRALVGGGMGAAYTDSVRMEDVKKAVDEAIKIARAAEDLSSVRMAEEEAHVDFWEVKEKEKITDMDNAEKVERLQDIDSSLAEKGFILARSQQLIDSILEKHILTSEGTEVSSRLPQVEYYYFIIAKTEKGSEQAYNQLAWSGGYEGWKRYSPEEWVTREAEILRRVIEGGRALKSGVMDLVVGPEVTGIAAHESSGHPSEADRILGREAFLAGESFIKPEMIGERIGSEVVNVVDDPTVEGSFGYYLYDDEGVPARRRYLYKEGKINEFLHNRETAAVLGTVSNGAARASGWSREPIVRMSTTFVEPRDHTVEELIEDVKYGIYMKSFTEWNIDDIRFNQKYVGREAYLIEKGEVGDPVKRPIIELTTRTFWSAVDAVGRDLEFVGATCGKSDPMQGVNVWIGGPHMRLRNVYMRW